MRITRLPIVIMLLFLAAPVAWGAGREGAVEGTLLPPDATAQITALKDGAVAARTQAGAGRTFRLPLPAGTYAILVSAPVSSFPVRLEGVVVRAGETTTLPPVLIMAGSGRAVLEGRVLPAVRDSEVTLFFEGKERASARTDPEGRYEFRELPAGTYEVRAQAPGHAADVAPVAVPENQRVSRTAVLLPVVATEGVDWEAGTVRAAGIGSPPRNAANAAQARAMTQRAAVADAQRNLLRIIERIKVDGDRTVGTIMRSRSGAERLEGYLKGYAVVSERDLGDGRIEVVLELPLTGPRGLSRYLAE